MRSLISADGHLTEPDDLWVDGLPAKYRDRAPRIAPTGAGRVLVTDGQPRPIPGLDASFVATRPGAQDISARLVDLASQGIESEVIYPQWTMALYGLADPPFLIELLRTYNTWLADVARRSNGRFIGIGLLPIHPDMDTAPAVEMIEEARQLDLKGVSIPYRRPGIRYNSRAFEPLWDAVEASKLPLSMHVGGTLEHHGAGAVAANITNNLQPFRAIWPIFVWSGILERHPGLRMVLTEGGIGWLPSTLFDMDMVFERFGPVLRPTLAIKPSDIWKRQCYATFQDDPAGLRLLDMIGPSTALWGADYPHPEGTFPRSQAIAEERFAGISEADTHAILYDNAHKLWLS